MSGIENRMMSEAEVLARVMAQAPAPIQTDAKQRPASQKRPWDLPGFHGKARVLTDIGLMPLEALRRRDKVRVASGAYVPVMMVDRIDLDEDFLVRHPNARPVMITAGSLASGRPEVDVIVSPAQMVNAAPLPQDSGYLSAAELAVRPGVMVRPTATATYFVFHVGKKSDVLIEGLWCRTMP